MKKLFVFLSLVLLASLSLFADRAFWLGSSYTSNSAASDKYTVSSSLLVKYGENETTVTVTSKLPRTLEGRELGLSQSALEKLGIWGNGDEEVSVKLLKGSVIDIENDTEAEESGWNFITLSDTGSSRALECYRLLCANDFKVRTAVSGENITFTIPYIAEYELEDRIEQLENLGFTVKEIGEAKNPYLQ